MRKLFKRSLAMVLALVMVLTMFAVAFAEETVVNVQFRAMDQHKDLALIGVNNELTTERVEGSGAVECITTADNGDLLLHIYRNGQASNPANIAGAEYVAFDLWVEEDNMFNNIAGDAGVNIDTAANLNAWGSSGGKADAPQVKEALKDLKAGWNKVVIKLNAASTATDAADMRLYMVGSGVSANKKFIIDDVRFLNEAGLAADQPRSAAKVVIAQIAAAKTAQDVVAAGEAYDALTDEQKEYVFNANTLELLKGYVSEADVVVQKIAALKDVATYAHKDEVTALAEEYNALKNEVEVFVTNRSDLDALVAMIATEQAAANNAIAKINAIPALDVLELTDEALVEIAREAYDALADDTKVAVTNVEVLIAAEEKIQQLIDVADDATRVAALGKAIGKLPEAEQVTLEDDAVITRVAEKYNALSEEAKALLSEESVQKLQAVVTALNTLKENKAAEEEVEAMIAALPVADAIVYADKAAVEAAKTAYENLNEESKGNITNKDLLDAAVAAMAIWETEKVAADEVIALVKALPETVTLENKEAVEAANVAYKALSQKAMTFIEEEIATKMRIAMNTIISAQPYDVCFRNFNLDRKNDMAFFQDDNNWKVSGQRDDYPAEGQQYCFAQATGEAQQLYFYVYGYNQNKDMDENGVNADGCAKVLINNIEDMYVTFDFYVSDASVVKDPTEDCGFNIDTKEGGGANQWGNTFAMGKNMIVSALKDVKDGWNHIVLPLKWLKAEVGEKLEGTTVTVEDFRFHLIGIKVPDGFVAGLDDVHFVNGLGLAIIDAQRTIAKGVTNSIRNYPAQGATADDFYKVYVAYNAIEDVHKEIVIGWDAFMEANAKFKADADAKLAADRTAVAPVVELIAALDREIALEDKEEIETAEAALASLNDNQKVLITNGYILTAARATYDAAAKKAADQAAADAIIAMINALPATVSDTNVSDATKIANARIGYDLLTEEQKALVATQVYEKLVAAETNIVIVKDKDAAAQVEEKINALPTPTDLTPLDIDAVNAVLDAYGKLTAAQKEYLSKAAVEKLITCVGIVSDPNFSILVGDVTGDGKIDAKDALDVLKITVGKITPNDTQKVAADADRDGVVGAKDALEILKYTVEKPSTLDKK